MTTLRKNAKILIIPVAFLQKKKSFFVYMSGRDINGVTKEEILKSRSFEKRIQKLGFDYTKQHSDEFYEEYAANFEQNKRKRLFFRFVKRSFDIFASALMLIILSPLMLIIAILVKCTSKGPIIFKQKRVGRRGKSFNCYKFRSMRVDAPSECATSVLKDPKQYLTKVGRVLRKLSLDELPQLWCVLIGSMSFIGYRPLILTEEKCNNMRNRLGVFDLRPGISGYAQVHGRDDVYYKNKAILDAYYVKNATLRMDFKLIFQTIWVVLKKDGNDDAVSPAKENAKENAKETAQEAPQPITEA